ncbi:MAG: acylphosphatase [Candidatus Thermoplasmatota archaeon]|nr:acylphosphatase [Candidatus Thermoplasmatota archaeon]
MMKVRLVIEGNVQGAGYRAMVKNVARRLRIKGLVRNLDDGDVEAFCECDENTLNRFIKIIDRKGDPEQPFSLNVEKINIYKEGNVNCVGLPKEFGLFETDYKMEIDPVHKDSLERSEIGILILSSMHHDLKEGQNDLKEGQNALKEGQDSMLKEQSAMHQDMNKSFKESDENINKNFNQLNETIGTKFESMDVKYGDISKTMREMHNDLKEMKNLFAKLVNHIVKE